MEEIVSQFEIKNKTAKSDLVVYADYSKADSAQLIPQHMEASRANCATPPSRYRLPSPF